MASQETARNFRLQREATVQELFNLAEQFEKGNRCGKKGKMFGTMLGVGGTVAAVSVGALSGGAAVPAIVATKALIGAKIAAGSGSVLAGGFTVGANKKNKIRQQAVEACLSSERAAMQKITEDLGAYIETHTGLLSNQQLEKAMLLKSTCTLAALGLSVSPSMVAQYTDVLNTINNIGCPLASVPHDRVLAAIQQVDIPFLRETFAVLDTPGADTAVEAVGEMIFDGLIPVTSVIMFPVHIVVLATDAREYHRKEHSKAANVLRKLAEKMQNDGQEIYELALTVHDAC